MAKIKNTSKDRAVSWNRGNKLVQLLPGQSVEEILDQYMMQVMANHKELAQVTAKVEEQPKEPVKEQPKEPVKEQPKEPVKEQPKEPVKEQPKEPVVTGKK